MLGPRAQTGGSATETRSRLASRSSQTTSATLTSGGTVVEVTAGLAHTCARLDDDTVRCWGVGASGQLGYGDTASIGDTEDPSSVGPVNVGAPVVAIQADGNHTCAITDTGAVRCWGLGGDGRLGYGNLETIGDDEDPADAGDVPLLPP